MLKVFGSLDLGMSFGDYVQRPIKFVLAQVCYVEALGHLDDPFRSQPKIKCSKVRMKPQGYAVDLHRLWNRSVSVGGWQVGEQVFKSKVQCRNNVERGASGEIMQENSPIITLSNTQAGRLVFVCGASSRPLTSTTRTDSL